MRSRVYLHQPESWKLAQFNIQQAREFGTNVEVLTEIRAREILPEICFDKVAGILFDPDSIRVRAADAIRAWPSSQPSVAHALNTARPPEHSCAMAIASSEFAQIAAICARPRSSSRRAWSRPLLSKAGADCPTTPVSEIRYTTRPLPEVRPNMPMLMFDDGFYIREEQGGLPMWGGD